MIYITQRKYVSVTNGFLYLIHIWTDSYHFCLSCTIVGGCLDVDSFFLSAFLIRQTKSYAGRQQKMLLMFMSNCENHYLETSKSQSVSMEMWEEIGLESTSF